MQHAPDSPPAASGRGACASALCVDDFVRVETAHAPSFSPDGRSVAFLSNRTGTFQGYVADLPGEETRPARRITRTDGAVYSVRFRPEHAQLLYTTDDGGDEHFRAHLVNLKDGASRILIGEPGVIVKPGAWSGDGRLLSYAANRRDRGCFDVYVLDVASGQECCLHRGDAHRGDAMNAAGRIGPDGAHVLIHRPNPELAGDTDLYLAPCSGGPARRLTRHRGRARWLQACFHPCGAVLALSDEGREHLGLQRIDPARGMREYLVVADWDIEAFALASDGSHLALVYNEDGYSRLEVRRLTADARTGADRSGHAQSTNPEPGNPEPSNPEPSNPELGTIPGGVISAPEWHPDGGCLAFGFEGPRTPGSVWASEPGRRAPYALSRPPRPPAAADLPEPELVRCPSFDGRPIPAFFYRPRRPARAQVPCLVLVHGGPESQSRPALWGRHAAPAYLLATGELSLLVPNVRGSTGYGKAFAHADDRERRMDAVRDLIAAADWVRGASAVDAQRLGVMGASYGGFMTLAAIAEAPQLWAAAVDLFGIADFVTFLEHTGPWRRRHRAAEYGDDPALLRALSPIHKVAHIRTPLLVVQGQRDVRVPPEESEQIVRAIRMRGGIVDYLAFEREGHGIQQLENRLAMARRIVTFLREHLIRLDTC